MTPQRVGFWRARSSSSYSLGRGVRPCRRSFFPRPVSVFADRTIARLNGSQRVFHSMPRIIDIFDYFHVRTGIRIPRFGQLVKMTASTKNVTVFVATATLLLALTIPATIADHAALTRTKRQLPPLEQGNQVIDDIFQVRLRFQVKVDSALIIKKKKKLIRVYSITS